MNESSQLRGILTCLLLLIIVAAAGCTARSAPEIDTSHGDEMIRSYFARQVDRIQASWLADVDGLGDWHDRAVRGRQQLQEMLGLRPMPERSDLKARITGTLDHPAFTVEKLHFQSIPGLYVTANLYIPKNLEEPAPGVLYLCGHANRYDNDVSLGAKAAYQHHPAWYARHGYVSLIIDTIQLGEIEGVHHGTYRRNRWWWWNRGYTPLGVEVWNGMRALDYLESRAEVDPERLSVTGRSGGGAYSWFLQALDERVQASVPTAGITDLQNYVEDRVVARHCDCMYMVNTRGWDFPMVAALGAPRPALMANGNTDPLFPLDGVRRTFEKAEQVYALYDRKDRFDTLIVRAAHDDIPPLQQGAYRWMHRHLRGQELTGRDSVYAPFEPADLKVFDELPEDEVNTSIDERFIQLPPEPEVPETRRDWEALRGRWMEQLRTDTFAGWPKNPGPLDVEHIYTHSLAGLQLSAYEFTSQPSVRLRLWVLHSGRSRAPERVRLAVVDSLQWQNWLGILQSEVSRREMEEVVGPGAHATPWPNPRPADLGVLRSRLKDGSTALAVLAPRGIGPTRWTQEVPGYEIRRSFMLLGQTRDGMRVWDVHRAVQVLREVYGGQEGTALELEGRGVMAGVALYGGLFSPAVERLHLHALPSSHRRGPILLNVRRTFDLPQAVAAAVNDRKVSLYEVEPGPWDWARQAAERGLFPEEALQFVSGQPMFSDR